MKALRSLWPLLTIPILPVPILAERFCRCLYGQKCWPDKAAFDQLASDVSQPLLYPKPPESACYPVSRPSSTCNDTVANAFNGTWRSEHPGATQFPNWESYIFENGTISACYLNTTLGLPCEQGNVPVIGVDARTVADVQAAVKFAASHDLRLVVKNTGHDYLGRSSARNAFMIWTHHMKDINYTNDFIPDDATSSQSYKAITLGAGVQWIEAYSAAEKHGRFLLGGLSAGGSVGAVGGWLQGGGHGAFASSFGLGVDNVLQFTAVTADGRRVTANAYKNKDLFWALRGGGGGTFAIVTSATYHTHDPFSIVEADFTVDFPTPTIAKAVLMNFFSIHSNLSEIGWGGYSFMTSTFLTVSYTVPNKTIEDARKAIFPFVDYASNVTGSIVQTNYTTYPAFYPWYLANFHTDDIIDGRISQSGSRLVSRNISMNNPEVIADGILSFPPGTFLGFSFVAGGTVSTVDPDETGLHPKWRDSIGHLYFGESWEEGDSIAVIQAARDKIISGVDILDPISPGSATYFNEASPYERDTRKTFFGSHYTRLRAIKQKYDPRSLYLVAGGVGSDEWDNDLVCQLPPHR